MKLYDTNALLQLDWDKLIQSGEKFYVTQTSLQELEGIKNNRNKDEGVRAKARHVARILNENVNTYMFVPYGLEASNLLSHLGMPETPDNMICACASVVMDTEDGELEFITGDLCCRLLGKNVFGLTVSESKNDEENIYKGYKVISGTTDEINQAMELIYSSQFDGWNVNEYLLIQNSDDGSEKEMRFDGNGFVSLRLPPSKFIKQKNALQRCALDILNNQDITIAAILGQYGSGKSYLTMRMALYGVQEKGYQSQILMVRSPEGEGKDPGALPGDLDDKVGRFLYPFSQQLDGGFFELESLRQRGVIDYNIPYYMKGTSYSSTILICDEAEDLDQKQLRLIGTRIGENSRIFLSGDYRQSIVDMSTKNALVEMCERFKGNKMFGCIYLGEDVRSTTSKMFANLFE